MGIDVWAKRLNDYSVLVTAFVLIRERTLPPISHIKAGPTNTGAQTGRG